MKTTLANVTLIAALASAGGVTRADVGPPGPLTIETEYDRAERDFAAARGILAAIAGEAAGHDEPFAPGLEEAIAYIRARLEAMPRRDGQAAQAARAPASVEPATITPAALVPRSPIDRARTAPTAGCDRPGSREALPVIADELRLIADELERLDEAADRSRDPG